MKTKNKKELEKHWAEQAKKASKPQPKTAPKKKSRENFSQAAGPIVRETTERSD
jgi:hypothetical protein